MAGRERGQKTANWGGNLETGSPVGLGDAGSAWRYSVGVLLPPRGPVRDTQAAAQEGGLSAPWWSSAVSATGDLRPPPPPALALLPLGSTDASGAGRWKDTGDRGPSPAAEWMLRPSLVGCSSGQASLCLSPLTCKVERGRHGRGCWERSGRQCMGEDTATPFLYTSNTHACAVLSASFKLVCSRPHGLK